MKRNSSTHRPSACPNITEIKTARYVIQPPVTNPRPAWPSHRPLNSRELVNLTRNLARLLGGRVRLLDHLFNLYGGLPDTGSSKTQMPAQKVQAKKASNHGGHGRLRASRPASGLRHPPRRR